MLHCPFNISLNPQGDLTRDELAQLLLCYIGTAADIIEFFDSFKVSEFNLVSLSLAIVLEHKERDKGDTDYRISPIERKSRIFQNYLYIFLYLQYSRLSIIFLPECP